MDHQALERRLSNHRVLYLLTTTAWPWDVCKPLSKLQEKPMQRHLDKEILYPRHVECLLTLGPSNFTARVTYKEEQKTRDFLIFLMLF